DHVGVLGTRSYCRKLELADFLLPRSVIADEILDDPFNERQSSIGFFDGEDLFHARTVCGADCGSSALRLATRVKKVAGGRATEAQSEAYASGVKARGRNYPNANIDAPNRATEHLSHLPPF